MTRWNLLSSIAINDYCPVMSISDVYAVKTHPRVPHCSELISKIFQFRKFQFRLSPPHHCVPRLYDCVGRQRLCGTTMEASWPTWRLPRRPRRCSGRSECLQSPQSIAIVQLATVAPRLPRGTRRSEHSTSSQSLQNSDLPPESTFLPGWTPAIRQQRREHL